MKIVVSKSGKRGGWVKDFEKIYKCCGKNIILITYDRLIASYAKRLITIRDGRILSDEQISVK